MNELEQMRSALTEVRKAYRLVYAYQRRVLDMANFIANKMDFIEYWWFNENFDVRSNRMPTKRWAWDLLPLYTGNALLFLRGDPNDIKKGDMLLDIGFNIDEGFIASGNHEPDPAVFKVADQCGSSLEIGMIVALENKQLNWLNQVYYKLSYPEINSGVKREDDFLLFINQYDLANVSGEEQLLKILTELETTLNDALAPYELAYKPSIEGG